MRSRDIKEKAVRVTLTTMAGSSLLALAGIVIFLFMEGLPLFSEYSFFNFLFGSLWYPTEEPGLFGIFPLLVASLTVTVPVTFTSPVSVQPIRFRLPAVILLWMKACMWLSGFPC